MRILATILLLVSSIAIANDFGSVHPAYETVENFSLDAGTFHDENPGEGDEAEPIGPPDELDPPDDLDPPEPFTYFDWGRGRDGTGYCYEFYRDGSIANDGRSMPNRFCEEVHPSYYDWARGRDGYIYCYQFTPYHLVMHQGRPVPDRLCR